MKSISITNARQTLYKLIAEIEVSHEPVHITGKKNNAVLVSEDDWNAIQETMYLLSIPKMRDSIIEGMKTPVNKCGKKIVW